MGSDCLDAIDERIEAVTRGARVAYALFAATPLFWPAPFIAIVVVYAARESVGRTWVASHLRWLRRTFWFTLLWVLIGSLTAAMLVGLVIVVIAATWFIYRISRGWLRLAEGQPM